MEEAIQYRPVHQYSIQHYLPPIWGLREGLGHDKVEETLQLQHMIPFFVSLTNVQMMPLGSLESKN